MRSQYKLTKRNFGKLKGRFKENFKCDCCGLGFRLGETVVSKRNPHAKKRHFYHVKCFNSLYLDL